MKLSDDFFTDDAMIAAGVEGRALYTSGLCHCARNQTDGFIDKSALQVVAALAGVPQEIADRLVAVDKWIDHGTRYEVRHYLDFNPSREQAIATQDRARKAAEARWNASSNATGNADAMPSRPVPSESQNSSSKQVLERSPQPVDDDVEEVLRMFADRKLAAANGAIKNPGPWKRKVLTNARLELAPTVRQWLADFDVSPGQAADALVAGSIPASWNNCRRRTS